MSAKPSQRLADWQAQALQRANNANGAETPEDAILRALLGAKPNAIADAAHLRANTPLIDHDYLAYWTDELGLQKQCRKLE